jgi:hypothetical protein
MVKPSPFFRYMDAIALPASQITIALPASRRQGNFTFALARFAEPMAACISSAA